jgi:hypothetical protein
MTLDPQAIPAFLFQIALFAIFIHLDPLVIHAPKEEKPIEASREAREIVMPVGEYNSILLHLPPKSG